VGYRAPDLTEAHRAIQHCLREIHSPYNDGWVSQSCKRDLYLLKSWLDQEYARLPKFSDEDKWEQERLINILQRR